MPQSRVHAWFVALLGGASLASAGPAAPVPADSPASASDAAAPPVLKDSSASAGASSPVLTDTSAPDPADGERPRLAVLRPTMIGLTDPALADRVADQLVLGMQHAGARVLARTAVDRVAAGPCDDGCLRGLRANLAVDRVLRTTIASVDRDFVVRLELVDAATRTQIAAREATCELCSLDELQRFVPIQAAGLVVAAAPRAKAPPRLRLHSAPAGARVYLDGRLIGLTPFDDQVPAGEHVVRLDLADHISESRRLSAAPGVQERMNVRLRLAPVTASVRRGGLALLFPGLVATMAGLTMLGIDGQPVRSRCAGVDIDMQGDCHYRFNTDVGGAVLLSAGALLVTAGVFVLVPPRGARKTRLRAGIGGAGLVLRGAF